MTAALEHVIDELIKFGGKMRKNTDYLKMEHLKDGYCYKIYANNAYVGVWVIIQFPTPKTHKVG